ncbi:hypothetical protein NH340_JMT05919 [Sarcoptes scabiei]|nr:hypothetical protein NH340_JMT05919 [Sarcoptes scabiei]
MNKHKFIAASSSSSLMNQSNRGLSINPQEDPYAIELDHLDVLDLIEDDAYLNEVVEFKKGLLNDSILMRKMFSLDVLSREENSSENRSFRKHSKSVKKHEDVDEIQDIVTVDEENVNVDEKLKDEEMSEDEDEEIPMDEIEEDNDYMESHFDNGEEYVD